MLSGQLRWMIVLYMRDNPSRFLNCDAVECEVYDCE